MCQDLIQIQPRQIDRVGERASWHIIEFFTANIRTRNIRAAYATTETPQKNPAAVALGGSKEGWLGR